MIWINIPTTFLRAPEFIGAEPAERATWLSVLGYSCEQENGGRIQGCRQWKDRRWQQTCGVTQDEVLAESELWAWDGDDLVVFAYPTDKEQEVQTKREIARENGKKGGRPPKTKEEPMQEPAEKPTSVPTSVPTLAPTSKSVKEGKGKEGKGSTPQPPGAGGHGNRFLPKGWRQWAARRQKSTRVLANSPTMQRMGRWFGRKPDTLWTVFEAGLLASLQPPEDEIELLESYYLPAMDADSDFRRRDLATLLNNWSSELDRARVWKTSAA